jgi:hypothetical protein
MQWKPHTWVRVWLDLMTNWPEDIKSVKASGDFMERPTKLLASVIKEYCVLIALSGLGSDY